MEKTDLASLFTQRLALNFLMVPNPCANTCSYLFFNNCTWERSVSNVAIPIDHLHASENILIAFLIAVTS